MPRASAYDVHGITMPVPAPLVALLLFGSGCSALIYQVAWLRTLRLVFGASTAASAAVLAIFLGGLGAGSLLLGRRADRTSRPLRLYAQLELGVALAAAASPLLILLVRTAYIALGGTARLGVVGGTGLRLCLSALVLGLPTLLMGGTLPAAVSAVEDAADQHRSRLGLLYGANTLGAVLGTLGATFVLLESFGVRVTIWIACLLNLVVALLAYALAQRCGARPADGRESPSVADRAPQAARPAGAPAVLVLAAAGIVGFAFLAMELVWYRMLAPVLGGSSYTFGLILAVALLGIGAGGVLYAMGSPRQRPTLNAFALTCALEAVGIALPYALGDRIAVLAMVLRPQPSPSFLPMILSWLFVTMLVVLPAALAAGYQFPLLVALLGASEEEPRIGRQVGAAYACNTAGTLLGALAGGFGLLPLLSAPGAWRAVVYLLVGVAVVTLLQALRGGTPRWAAALPIVLGALGLWLCRAQGPTAFWRHSAIGAGRTQPAIVEPNELQHVLNDKRRRVVWEAEGVESAVALAAAEGYNFIVNGKSDGNALDDAPTQVMSGLIGALLHPEPKRVLVIGLGTGSTAGWLAQVPSVERVDVIELEPVVVHVAEVCSPVNQRVLSNPKVHLTIGDGREFLLTSSEQYDLVFSEPSNPYRAGVASLYTREFYEAVAARLSPDGVLAQWVQAYEVQPRTVRTVYATLGAVFPSVETWEVKLGADLLLTARRQRQPHDLALIRRRLETEPYRSALALIWGVRGAEGLYTGFVADAGFAADVHAAAGTRLSTDDDTVVEYQFARSVGVDAHFSVEQLRRLAAARNQAQPAVVGGTLNRTAIEELRSVRAVADGRVPQIVVANEPSIRARLLARRAYASGALAEARQQWLAQREGPDSPMDVTMVAEILAANADPAALSYAEALQGSQPAEAEAIIGRWSYAANQPQEAAQHLLAALHAYQTHPWAYRELFKRTLALVLQMADEHPELAPTLLETLGEPFAARALDDERIFVRTNIGLRPGLESLCAAAIAPLEPNVPWERQFLEKRAACYRARGNPAAPQAQADLDAFVAQVPVALEDGLQPAQPQPVR